MLLTETRGGLEAFDRGAISGFNANEILGKIPDFFIFLYFF
jgi:hypothetical protein